MKLPDNVLIVLIVMLSIFAPLATDMFLPALDTMVEYFDTDEATFNMTLYMFMLFLAIGMLFLGPVSDKYGRRNVLIGSLALFIVSSMLCSFAESIEMMIFFRILQALGAGGSMTNAIALIRDCFTGERRNKVLTIVAVIGVLGPVIAPILGQFLIWEFDWKATFWVPALFALACLLMSLLLPSDIPKERYEGSIMSSVATMLPILKNGDFRRFAIMMNMVAFSLLAYISVSEYIYKGKGFDVGDAYPFYLAGAMVLGVLLMLIIRKFKPSNKRYVQIIFILTLVATVLMWTVGSLGPILFFIAVVPMITTSSVTRSFGLTILLGQDVGNSGAISSVLNFVHFLFATAGMIVVVNLPFSNYVESVAFCFTIFLVVYTVLWAYMRIRGTSLKGME
jgi:DHA1 family bicyclomycin/chloramphenicol resistance-like MFS transporter